MVYFIHFLTKCPLPITSFNAHRIGSIVIINQTQLILDQNLGNIALISPLAPNIQALITPNIINPTTNPSIILIEIEAPEILSIRIIIIMTSKITNILGIKVQDQVVNHHGEQTQVAKVSMDHILIIIIPNE